MSPKQEIRSEYGENTFFGPLVVQADIRRSVFSTGVSSLTNPPTKAISRFCWSDSTSLLEECISMIRQKKFTTALIGFALNPY